MFADRCCKRANMVYVKGGEVWDWCCDMAAGHPGEHVALVNGEVWARWEDDPNDCGMDDKMPAEDFVGRCEAGVAL